VTSVDGARAGENNDLRATLQGIWRSGESSGPLSGVRVVDLGQYIAGPLAATLLADQGADVVRIEVPGGPRLESAANAMLLRGRRTVTLDLTTHRDRARAQALIASADVVIENFRPGVCERLGVGPERMCAASPQLVYCSLPGFGADDSRADLAGWEGVVMAAAGAYSLEVSSALIPGWEGVQAKSAFSPLPLASLFGATEGAMAIVAALIARARDGVGQAIEVPLFDSLFEAIGLRGLSYERNGPGYTNMGGGTFRCADGRFVFFAALWMHHLERFARAADVEGWIDEGIINYDRLMSDPAVAIEMRSRLTELFATRPAEAWEQLLRDCGCPASMLRSTDEWLVEPHARVSGTFVDVLDPVFGNVRVPGPAIRVHGVTSGSVGARLDPTEHDEAILEQIDRVLADRDADSPLDREPSHHDEARSSTPPLQGINVLDLSRVVAAPTAAKLLGQLGADVIKLDEDPKLAQCATPVPAFHEHLNRAKRTIVLDLKTDADAAVFRSLVDQADVVVENFTIGVADRLGASFDALREHAPSVVVLSLNAYGRTGPWAPHRGYAELANFATGVTERTVGDSPQSVDELTDLPRWTYTDYLAGVLGAFGVVTALYDRLRSGTGRLVETSLVRATALEQILAIVAQLDDEHEMQGRIDADREPRGRGPKGWSARQSIYETTDGAIYLGAQAEQLDGVLRDLQIESPASDAELHAQLTDAFATRRTADALKLLDTSDVGAHRVTSVGEIMSVGNVADQRGLRLEDHTPNLGAVVMPGPVVRFDRTPMRPGGLPVPFGEDHDEIVALAVDGTWRRHSEHME